MPAKPLTDKIVSLIDHLPPMPNNIIRLRKAAADPNVNFNQLVPILKEDPGLCADILHIANSAFYGVHHTVDTIDEAVRYFGVEHLIEFVSVSFSEKTVKKFFHHVKNLNDYFDHSRQISTAAYLLAKHAKKSVHEQNQFAIAGLLHDLDTDLVNADLNGCT